MASLFRAASRRHRVVDPGSAAVPSDAGLWRNKTAGRATWGGTAGENSIPSLTNIHAHAKSMAA
jgi:hypothetical protein